MATRTRAEVVDDEFLHALYEGGELLAAGKVVEAKDHLEKAFQLQPKNEKGQNLLGLTYFKLGMFERASEIYETLVRENPADPTLRVNLGLVYLKTNALQRAIREFEVATDLQPDHKKSQNYLGLALAQAGEFGRAREHFLLAGSDAMALKMERALAGETVIKPIPRPPDDDVTQVVPEPRAPEIPETAEREAQVDLMSDELPPAPAATNGTGRYEPEIVSEEPAPEPPPAGEVSWGEQYGLTGEDTPPAPPPDGVDASAEFTPT